MDHHRVAKFVGRSTVAFGGFVLGAIALCVYMTLQRTALTKNLTASLQASMLNTAFGGGNEEWMFSRIGKTFDYFSFTSSGLWLPIVFAAIIVIAMVYFSKSMLSKRNFIAIAGTATILQLILFARMWFPSRRSGNVSNLSSESHC